MTPQIITTLVIIVAMFALMLLNKFPLAVTMTLTGVALWLTGIVEPAKLYSNFGGSTIIFLIGMSIEVYALEVRALLIWRPPRSSGARSLRKSASQFS